jgi:hypothetical protein
MIGEEAYCEEPEKRETSEKKSEPGTNGTAD